MTKPRFAASLAAVESRPAGVLMKLSVIVPTYNEVDTIGEVLQRVRAVELPLEREIILVDDGSTDGTREIIAAEAASDDVIALFHPRNRGKGAAVRSGIAQATGDWLIIQDADLELDPADYARLLSPVLAGQAQVVYGSRFRYGYGSLPLRQRFGNAFLTWLTNLLYGARLTDMETCYKLLPTEVMQGIGIRANRFEIEPEITAKLLKRGYHIHEVPISYRYRNQDEGKKLCWRDGVQALWALIKYRFVD